MFSSAAILNLMSSLFSLIAAPLDIH